MSSFLSDVRKTVFECLLLKRACYLFCFDLELRFQLTNNLFNERAWVGFETNCTFATVAVFGHFPYTMSLLGRSESLCALITIVSGCSKNIANEKCGTDT